MDEAVRLVKEAMADARSDDGMVGDLFAYADEDYGPLDRETLDELASTQMGARFESDRLNAND